VPVEEISGIGSPESEVGATEKGPPGAVAATGVREVEGGVTRQPSAAVFPRYVTAIVAAALVIVALLVWMIVTPPAAPKVLRVVQVTHFGLASAVETDGVRLYIGQEKGGRVSLVQVPVDGGEPVPIPTPFRNVALLDISPDRSQLLVASFNFRNDPKLLWIMPLTGGSPHRLGDIISESAKWSPDGSHIAFSAEDGALCLVNSDGSGIRKLVENGGGVESWSPDGGLIRFTRTNGATGGESLWEVQSDGKNLRPFLPERQSTTARWNEGQCCGRWTPDGKYFLFREAFYPKVGLWANRGKVGLLQFRRPEPVEIYAAGFDIGSPAIDPNGRRVFFVGKNESRELVRYDRGLRQFVPLPLVAGTQTVGVSWAADGQWFDYLTFPDQALWRAKRDDSERLQLTFSPMQVYDAAWSPDDQRLAFHELEPGKPGKIGVVRADGGTPEILFENESTGEDVPNWSPDGNTLMFARTSLDKDGNTAATSICTLDMKTRQVSKLPGSDDMGPPSWSHDGRYVAAQSGDFRKLVVFDFPSQQWRELASGGFINNPLWSHDSKFVYFQDTLAGEEQPIYRVSVAGGKAEEVASRKQLLRADVGSYRLAALDPNDEPVAVIVRRNADVYALDLSLPD
jgi:Tol biopolymer transport system component